MIVTADEVNRSLRGAIALFNRREDGLQAFDMSEEGFWRSFTAIWLTLPAYVVSLAFERLRLGIEPPDGNVLDNVGLDLLVAVGHAASFVALPLAMIWLAPRLGLTRRYVPFVIVTNWINVGGLLVLSVPAALLLMDWATPSLATLFTLCFAVLIVRLQWFATKLTLGVPGSLAAAVVGLGILINASITWGMHLVTG